MMLTRDQIEKELKIMSKGGRKEYNQVNPDLMKFSQFSQGQDLAKKQAKDSLD